MKKLLALCMVIVLVASIFTSCQGNGAGSGGNKEIIINLGSEPPEMNSILTTSTGSMNVLRHIMDGLTMLNEKDEVIPGMAESWTVSDDGTTYTFTLRKGAKWTNGEEVTAHDFIFAWDTLFTAETAAQYAATWAPLIVGAMEKLESTELSAEAKAVLDSQGYENGVGYKALDDYTIQLTTTGPYPYFLSVLAFPNMLPMNEKAYNEIGSDKYGTEAEYLVTNGAFKMTSWLHEDSLVLEKAAGYWDSSVKLSKITMMMITDTGTALNTFLAGDIDMIGLNGEQSMQMKNEGRTIQTYDDGSTWYFEYNTTLPGLNNAKVRRALTLGVDAEAFINNVVKNNSNAAYSFVPAAIQNGEFSKAVGKLIQRVENDDYSAVKALLEEGLAEEKMTLSDFTLTLIADDTDTAALYSAFFQEQWKTHLAVNVSVEQMTYKNRLERMSQKDFSVVFAGWGPDYNDPMTFLDIFTTGNGNNHTSYANPEYDALLAQALKEPDAAKRQEILIQCDQILIRDMPIGSLYNRARDFITSDRLSGVVRTAFADIQLRYADVK